MKKVLFIYNPVSGSGSVKNSLSDLVNECVKKGYKVEVYPTQSQGDAINKIKNETETYDRIIAAGGDGMFHEVVNGIMESKKSIPFGMIPLGTVNDFASNWKIPNSPMKAIQTALEPVPSTIDIGKFNNQYFTYVAAFGVGTEVSYSTDQSLKQRFGYLAYLNKSLKTIDFVHWENNSVVCKVNADGKEFEGDFIFGYISNTKSIGGSDLLINQEVSWHDGLLEGLFIRRPMSMWDLDIILRSLRTHNFDNPFFIQVKAARFEIKHAEPFKWTLDGEYGGELSEIVAECIPNSIQIFANHDPE